MPRIGISREKVIEQAATLANDHSLDTFRNTGSILRD